MSPPQRPDVTIVVDGVEISAPEGKLLVDAAKQGDVEIPVFCYEPKLGAPVGACRMCLVEIEGIPKLQTACSTPIRDGMVVYTQTDRVKEAQNSVVEFLLVNHPLDCPVCDKGGECPLQDVAMGWGPGKSRVTDAKRHFQKPIPLSPLIKIDRERCILCYRCVRFSQEVSEDEQLQLLERGDRTYVGTHEDRPYVGPFHGNIIELCPVGALTSESYRFRARPWDIEDAGSVCTLCPSQCNVKFTVRDEKVVRVLDRQNDDVDDGWLCDKGRFGFQMFDSEDRPTAPRIRVGGALASASWEDAIERSAKALKKAGSKTAVLVGGGTSNEEGYLLQRLLRDGLGSADIDSRTRGSLSRQAHQALSQPDLTASMADVAAADAILVLGTDPLHEMPILDLRIRKAQRYGGAKLCVATERPTALDGGTAPDRPQTPEAIRYAPGDGAAVTAALAAAVREDSAAGAYGDDVGAIAKTLAGAERVVVIWGEELSHDETGANALLGLADALGMADQPGSGMLEVPIFSNARGLREVGCLPTAGPGLSEVTVGRSADEIRAALENEELEAVILWDIDPVRDLPNGEGWSRALGAAEFVLSVSLFGNASATNADVYFPAETHAEKEGTVTHPDGRLQRMRPSVAHRDQGQPLWQALVELSNACEHETGFDSATDVLGAIADDVGIYAGVTAKEIGGTGVRWQERSAADALETDALPTSSAASPAATGADAAASAGSNGGLALGAYRDLWANETTERNPSLEFLRPDQSLELAPADAQRLGVSSGDLVEVVAPAGATIQATVILRERMRTGAGFLITGTPENNPNRLIDADVVEIRRIDAAPAEPS